MKLPFHINWIFGKNQRLSTSQNTEFERTQGREEKRMEEPCHYWPKYNHSHSGYFSYRKAFSRVCVSCIYGHHAGRSDWLRLDTNASLLPPIRATPPWGWWCRSDGLLTWLASWSQSLRLGHQRALGTWGRQWTFLLPCRHGWSGANPTYSTGLLRWAEKIILVKILEHTVRVLGIILRGQTLSSLPQWTCPASSVFATTFLKGNSQGHMNHQNTQQGLCFLQGPFSFVFSFYWQHGL